MMNSSNTETNVADVSWKDDMITAEYCQVPHGLNPDPGLAITEPCPACQQSFLLSERTEGIAGTISSILL